MLAFDDTAIVYEEKQPPIWLRLFLIFLGTGISVAIPAPYIAYANWSEPSWTLLLAIACIVFPLAAGLFFIRIGLVSATFLRFDPATGRCDRRLRGPIRHRDDSFAFSTIPAPVLVMRDSEEDGPYPILRLHLPDGQKLEMACFDGKADAERWRARLAGLLREGRR